MANLTEARVKVLLMLESFFTAHGWWPSQRKVGRALGMSSSSTISGHIVALEELGFVQRKDRHGVMITTAGFVELERLKLASGNALPSSAELSLRMHLRAAIKSLEAAVKAALERYPDEDDQFPVGIRKVKSFVEDLLKDVEEE